ncbi:hypothetical protein ACSBR1_020516 [Camellia fascicularis]
MQIPKIGLLLMILFWNLIPSWNPFTDPSAYHPVLSWGSFGTCGRRETMEDTHFLMPHMCGEKDIHVFGIFDGHRGAAAAEFSARALPGFLQSLGSIKSPSDALLEAFVKIDVAFRNELDSHRKSKGVIQKDWHPGCTAIVALIVRNKLFVANAGDCRAMLCQAGSAYALSKDHVASCPEERERIISEGGQVKWQVDTWRVGPAALQGAYRKELPFHHSIVIIQEVSRNPSCSFRFCQLQCVQALR